jgi:hypothetical protein
MSTEAARAYRIAELLGRLHHLYMRTYTAQRSLRPVSFAEPARTIRARRMRRLARARLHFLRRAYAMTDTEQHAPTWAPCRQCQHYRNGWGYPKCAVGKTEREARKVRVLDSECGPTGRWFKPIKDTQP